MEHFTGRRFAALLLALLLAAACVLPAAAVAVPPAGSVSFTEVTPPEDTAPPPYHQLTGDEPQAMSDEPLRALIVLEKPSLLEMGYDAADLTAGGAAAAYNDELKQDQETVIAAIEAATGEPLDVVWRLTVVANLLSVWVVPSQMDIIAAVPGVQSVREEAIAVLQEPDDGETGGEEISGGDEPDGEEISGSEDPAGEPDAIESSGGPAADGAGDDPVDGGQATVETGDDPADGGQAAGETVDDPVDGGQAASIAVDDPANGSQAAGETGGPDEPAEQDLRPDWLTDYKGDGQRIAIIDTGTDEWHRSLNSSAWMYALDENAKLLVGDLTDYLATLDLLDAGGIDEVLDDLAVVQRNFGLPLSAETRQDILNALAGHGEAETRSGRSLRKVAFGANYASKTNYADIAHHEIEEHGSHVAGIAAANLYIPTEECWDPVTGRMKPGVEARYVEPKVTVKKEDTRVTTEKTDIVTGQAPNAQLLVMKVFDPNEGSRESDFIAAINDALLLGADTVNLSLGSNAPEATFAQEPVLQEVVDRVAESGAIVVAAHGNSYYWTHVNSNDNPPPSILSCSTRTTYPMLPAAPPPLTTPYCRWRPPISLQTAKKAPSG